MELYKYSGLDKRAKLSLFEKDISTIKIMSRKVEHLFRNELDEIINDILILKEENFLNHIKNGVLLELEDMYSEDCLSNKKLNKIVNNSLTQIKKEYEDNYAFLIKTMKNNNSISSSRKRFSNKNEKIRFRKHCINDEDFPSHNCEKKVSKFIIAKNKNNEIKFLICPNCKKVYYNSFILCKCYYCNMDYYTNILDDDEDPNLLPATWENYHCPQILSEKMKCIKCFETFYIDMKTGMLKCINKNCNFTISPTRILWTCSTCKEDFKSGCVPYNPLEITILKKVIRSALILKQRAHPNKIPCCKLDIYYTDFYHNKNCKGILYFGEYNNDVVIICEKCKTTNFCDRFIWTCPKCGKKFRDNENYFYENLNEDQENGEIFQSDDDENFSFSNNDDENINEKNPPLSSRIRQKKFISLNSGEEKKFISLYSGEVKKYDTLNTEINDDSVSIDLDDICFSSRNTKYMSKIQNHKRNSKSFVKNHDKSEDDAETNSKNNLLQKRFYRSKRLIVEIKDEKKEKSKEEEEEKEKEKTKEERSLRLRKERREQREKEKREREKQREEEEEEKEKKEKEAKERKQREEEERIKKEKEDEERKQKEEEERIKKEKEDEERKQREEEERIKKEKEKVETSKKISNKKVYNFRNRYRFRTSNNASNYHKTDSNISQTEKDENNKDNNNTKDNNKDNNNNTSQQKVNSNNFRNRKKYLFINRNKTVEENTNQTNDESKNKIGRFNKSMQLKNNIIEKEKTEENEKNEKNEKIDKKTEKKKPEGKKTLGKIVHEDTASTDSKSINNNNNLNNNLNTSKNNILGISENLLNHLNKRIQFILDKYKLPIINVEDYTICQRIGEGGYGIIFSVIDKKDKKRYALKKIISNALKEIDNYTKEFELVHLCNHKNIMKIYGICIRILDTTTYALYVLMELSEGDWDEEIKNKLKQKKKYSEIELIDILYQLTNALLFMQEKLHISHRDIKPQNILIFPGNKYKLADFGEAKKAKISKQNNTLRGTELFMSPALYYGLKHKKDDVNHNPFISDVFSLGYCFLYASALNFNLLYEVRDISDDKTIDVIIHKCLQKIYSERFISILAGMLEIDESKRLTFPKIIQLIKNNYRDEIEI